MGELHDAFAPSGDTDSDEIVLVESQEDLDVLPDALTPSSTLPPMRFFEPISTDAFPITKPSTGAMIT